MEYFRYVEYFLKFKVIFSKKINLNFLKLFWNVKYVEYVKFLEHVEYVKIWKMAVLKRRTRVEYFGAF